MIRDYVPMPPELRRQILKRDNYTCQECGYIGGKKDYDIHVHHIVPYRVGGEHAENNLITLCSLCHNQRDKEHKLWLKSTIVNRPLRKPIRQQRNKPNLPTKITGNNTFEISARAARKIAYALKSIGYGTANRDNCRGYVINIAKHFEPGDTEARQKLLRLICEAAGIQPRKQS